MSKICDVCAFEYVTDECPRCAVRRARMGKAAPAEAEVAPDADKLGLEQDRLMGGQAAEPVIELPPPAEAEPEAAPPREPEAKAPPVEPEPEPAEAEPETDEPTPIEAEDFTVPPASSIGFDPQAFDDGDVSSATLKQLRASGDFVVALLGYPTAGKTWFMNRLKKFCVADSYSVTPPPARPGEVVGGTAYIEDHYFANKEGKFVLIDIPGERFERAILNRFATEPRLLEVVQTCRAMIVVLPTDEVLFSGRAAAVVGAPARAALRPEVEALDRAVPAQEAAVKRAKSALTKAQKDLAKDKGDPVLKKVCKTATERLEAAEAELRTSRERQGLLAMADAGLRLETFVEGIGSLAAVASLLDAGKTPAEVAAYDHRAIASHIVTPGFREWSQKKPVFAALTKADLLTREDPVVDGLVVENDDHELELLEHFDRDPLETVRHFRPELANQFQAWFGWSKFDFVTAFGGHDGSPVIQYDRAHHGVWAVIEWIWWAFDVSRWNKAEWKAVKAAQWMRARRDGPQARGRVGQAGSGRG